MKMQSMGELTEYLLSDKVKLISFDCFDTLLLWPYEPYVMVEIAAASHNHSIASYKRMRNYGGWWGTIKTEHEPIVGTNTESKQYKADELAFDRQVIRPRKSMQSLFNRLISAGKEIVITTDMYLSEEFISELLKNNGYDGFSKIYLSKNGLSKGNGRLFDKIIEDYSDACLPENIVHIGDNRDVDYVIAKQHKLNAIHLEKPLTLFKKSRIGSRFVPTSNGDRIIIGMIANYIFDDPFEDFENITLKQFSYLVGAFLTTFGLWMNNDAINRKIKKIYLIMSDGYLINKLFSIFKQVINTVDVEPIYLSRSSRSDRILLDEGITGDLKQIKYYVTLDAFKDETIEEAKHIIDNVKQTEKMSFNDMIRLNQLLDYEKIKHNVQELDAYLEYKFKKSIKYALFDGSYNATALEFMNKYYSYKIDCEYQLIGSPKNGCVYNYVQTKVFNVQGSSFDTDPCIKTTEKKVDRVRFDKGEWRYIVHGPERPNIVASLIQSQTLEFASSLLDVFHDQVKNLSFNSYTFWNPIVYLWETHNEAEKELLKCFNSQIITKRDLGFAKSVFEINKHEEYLANYYLALCAQLEKDISAAIVYAEKASDEGIVVGEKLFIDLVMSNNYREKYSKAIGYILDLEPTYPEYYARMGRLLKMGKGVDMNID